MFLLLILAVSFYLYKTGELQRLFNQIQPKETNSSNELKEVIDTTSRK